MNANNIQDRHWPRACGLGTVPRRRWMTVRVRVRKQYLAATGFPRHQRKSKFHPLSGRTGESGLVRTSFKIVSRELGVYIMCSPGGCVAQYRHARFRDRHGRRHKDATSLRWAHHTYAQMTAGKLEFGGSVAGYSILILSSEFKWKLEVGASLTNQNSFVTMGGK